MQIKEIVIVFWVIVVLGFSCSEVPIDVVNSHNEGILNSGALSNYPVNLEHTRPAEFNAKLLVAENSIGPYIYPNSTKVYYAWTDRNLGDFSRTTHHGECTIYHYYYLLNITKMIRYTNTIEDQTKIRNYQNFPNSLPILFTEEELIRKGGKNLSIRLKASETVEYLIETRTYCPNSPTLISDDFKNYSFSVDENLTYTVYPLNYEVFVPNPALNEKWYLSNNITGLVFSDGPLNSIIVKDNDEKEEFCYYSYNISELDFSVWKLGYYSNQSAGAEEWEEDYTPVVLEEENHTFRYLYRASILSSRELGGHEMTIEYIDLFGERRNYSKKYYLREYRPGEEGNEKYRPYPAESLDVQALSAEYLSYISLVLLFIFLNHFKKSA